MRAEKDLVKFKIQYTLETDKYGKNFDSFLQAKRPKSQKSFSIQTCQICNSSSIVIKNKLLLDKLVYEKKESVMETELSEIKMDNKDDDDLRITYKPSPQALQTNRYVSDLTY